MDQDMRTVVGFIVKVQKARSLGYEAGEREGFDGYPPQAH